MIKKTISYVDYNGNERTEDFWFNMTPAEVFETNYSVTGGFEAVVKKIMDTQDVPALIKLFKEIILKAYGEKSLDGRRFIKSEELATAFSQTEAYSELYMELATNDKAASDFINGVLPSKELMDRYASAHKDYISVVK